MHKLTPNEKSEAEWECAEEPPYAPVHGWAVPPPKLDGPLRKVAEREADDPEGNLTIVEWGVRKRQRCFSCREYGWGGSAHISEQHPILYGKAVHQQVLYGNDRAPNAASPFWASRATPSRPSRSSAWFSGGAANRHMGGGKTLHEEMKTPHVQKACAA